MINEKFAVSKYVNKKTYVATMNEVKKYLASDEKVSIEQRRDTKFLKKLNKFIVSLHKASNKVLLNN